eukprot:4430588-Alexandrium_andersonii.AAC.1
MAAIAAEQELRASWGGAGSGGVDVVLVGSHIQVDCAPRLSWLVGGGFWAQGIASPASAASLPPTTASVHLGSPFSALLLSTVRLG